MSCWKKQKHEPHCQSLFNEYNNPAKPAYLKTQHKEARYD